MLVTKSSPPSGGGSESYMNPEPGFQSGPGDPVDANEMASRLLVAKSSPPSVGAQFFFIIYV